MNNYKHETSQEASIGGTEKKLLEISQSNEFKKSDTLVEDSFTAAVAEEKTAIKEKAVLDDAPVVAAVVPEKKEKKGIFRKVRIWMIVKSRYCALYRVDALLFLEYSLIKMIANLHFKCM